MRFDTWIGIALSWMPPCIVALVGFWCFLATLMPSELSTMTLLRSGIDVRDLAPLADVLALDDLHVVTLLELHLGLRIGHHNTSGASDTMRMNRRSRSSRPTGPKMRVPRGCICSLISTAAFSSKRM